MSADRAFQTAFGALPVATVFTPGRVNLIGEHIDYNGGRVLPFALQSGVWVAVGPSSTADVTVVSDRFEGTQTAPFDGDMQDGWARYAYYAARLAYREGWIEHGVNIAVSSNLADGAGLSSSSALCVAVLKALKGMSGVAFDDTAIAKLARRVENDDIGMPCGIMDQMAVAIGQPGEAIFLDTASLDYDVIRLPTDYEFIVLHSGVRRELADGRYRARKEECDAAKALLGTDDLCHLDPEVVDQVTGMAAPLRRRVRHCISEHQRTVAAAAALREGRLEDFGRLMDQSHHSMRVDFEMSVPPVDQLVALAKEKGALGARLTGGGFGGCIVACVDRATADDWKEAVLAAAPDAFAVS